jgi:8-oxo-dGTP pyrophosphatase MutT (NUDIX family)
VEQGERIATAALRELREETGFGAEAVEAFYDLDLVNQFHEPSYDAVVTAAVFAVRIAPEHEPELSNEHNGSRWLPLSLAHREVIWPAYRTALERIRDDLADADRAAWFELTLDGQRLERRPGDIQ